MANVITTKKELIDVLSEFNDDDQVVIEVHDTVLYEDLYQFYIDPIDKGEFGIEIRLCPIETVQH